MSLRSAHHLFSTSLGQTLAANDTEVSDLAASLTGTLVGRAVLPATLMLFVTTTNARRREGLSSEQCRPLLIPVCPIGISLLLPTHGT